MNVDTNRIRAILDRLIDVYGTEAWNWHTRQSPYRVLIGTVLSQRTRDEKTDEAAKSLFEKYPTPESLALAPLAEIEACIRPVNYYRTKAARIQEISRILVDDYDGEVPPDVEELLKLPGVGRKTANCVMVYGFKKAAIPVDTHVHRISNRLGIVRSATPEETEEKLQEIIPRQYVQLINELLVKHGQTLCRPVGPRCSECFVSEFCDYAGNGKDVCEE